MTKNEINQLLNTTLAPGFKGMFFVYPVKKIIKEKEFFISLGISFCIFIFAFLEPEIALDIVDTVIDLAFLSIPAILGISITGFAIVVSLVSNRVLKKIVKIYPKEDSEPKTSFYQQINAVFGITVLAQAVCLLLSIIIKGIMPFTLKVLVHPLLAQILNALLVFILTLVFAYSLLILICLVKNIFTLGQTVNYVYLTENSENQPENE